MDLGWYSCVIGGSLVFLKSLGSGVTSLGLNLDSGVCVVLDQSFIHCLLICKIVVTIRSTLKAKYKCWRQCRAGLNTQHMLDERQPSSPLVPAACPSLCSFDIIVVFVQLSPYTFSSLPVGDLFLSSALH